MAERGIDPNELEDDYAEDEEFEDDEGDEPDEDEDEFQAYGPPLTPEDTVDFFRVIGERRGFVRADGLVTVPIEMVCRVCGCSDSRACPGGCIWAAPNLCSRCVA